MRALMARMGPWQKLKLWAWQVLGVGEERPLELKLRPAAPDQEPPRFAVRPPPALDLLRADRVFGEQLFALPRPLAESGTARLVDLDGNVGLVAVAWAVAYPNAKVVVFEPHPDLVDAIGDQALLNLLGPQLVVHPHEPGRDAGAAVIDNPEEQFGSIFQKGGAQRWDVRKVDVFSVLGEAPIGALKVRVDRRLATLLDDPRFRALRIDQLVLEGVAEEERARWVERLAALGFQAEPSRHAGTDVLWASSLR